MRTPVVENLQPARQYIRLLNIDPIVGHQFRPLFFILYFQLVKQQADRNEVTILKVALTSLTSDGTSVRSPQPAP